MQNRTKSKSKFWAQNGLKKGLKMIYESKVTLFVSWNIILPHKKIVTRYYKCITFQIKIAIIVATCQSILEPCLLFHI